MEKNKILQIVPFANKGGVESVANNLFINPPADSIIIYGYIKDSQATCPDKIFLKSFFSLFKYLNNNRVNVIHSHVFSLRWMIFIRLCSLFFKIKMITTLHSDFGIIDSKVSLLKKGRRLFFIKILHSFSKKALSDKWVAISDSVENLLVNILKIEEKRVIKIYNPVDNTNVDVNESSNRKYMVFVGRDSKEKNLKDLLYIWKTIQIKYDFISLALIGIDPDSESLGCYEDLKSERVLALGWLDDASKNIYLKDALIQVIPSYFEGFCLAAVEALEKNIPIITYDLPVFNYLKKQFNGVHIASSFERDKLLIESYTAINNILAGYETINNKKNISVYFSQNDFIDRHHKLYKELTNR
ncbi:glycosyltransferase family 4 protein [Salmonella enterica]|nr:glycosyltransferase family 4 protein [Salmonella enterica]